VHGIRREGRNIQFCNTLINFDIPWNPMAIEQRIGRIDRIGQTREVFVFNLVARGTVEEQVLRLLDEKINMFELVVGEAGAILGELKRSATSPNWCWMPGCRPPWPIGPEASIALAAGSTRPSTNITMPRRSTMRCSAKNSRPHKAKGDRRMTPARLVADLLEHKGAAVEALGARRPGGDCAG